MRHRVFAVFDSKAGGYLQPFFSVNTPTAVRAFADAVRDPTHAFARHPADFSLFWIGHFDDVEGQLEAQARECVITAIELKARYAPGLEADQRELALKVVS